MINIKDPVVLFERNIEEENFEVVGDVMPPWHRWLLYVEAAKARREVPLSYFAWSQLQGIEVEPDEDDVA